MQYASVVFYKSKTTTTDSRLLPFQQPPVGGDLHLQVLLDAQQLLIAGLGALHVQS